MAKIISGEKTVESRWYKFKKTPYKNIEAGDTVYFKESGDPVTVRSRVRSVLFFDSLSEEGIEGIIGEYGDAIGVDSSYGAEVVGKKYCTLVFLEDVREISPFEIDKTGYGIMSAWITVPSIDKIKK